MQKKILEKKIYKRGRYPSIFMLFRGWRGAKVLRPQKIRKMNKKIKN